VHRLRKRLPVRADGGDLSHGLEPRVVRASGETQHEAWYEEQGNQERPASTD